MSRPMVDVAMVFRLAFERSVTFADAHGREHDLPRSQIEFDADATRGDIVTVKMPEWLAFNEGLI